MDTDRLIRDALAAMGAADPHPALWAEWQRLRARVDAKGGEGPEADAAEAGMLRAEALLRSLVATTPEGLAAQFEYMAEDILEQGKGCATIELLVAPFIGVFRDGLARRAAAAPRPPAPPPSKARTLADIHLDLLYVAGALQLLDGATPSSPQERDGVVGVIAMAAPLARKVADDLEGHL